MTGHVHGTHSVEIKNHDHDNDGMYYSTVGSLGVDFCRDFIKKIDSVIDGSYKKQLEDKKYYISPYNNHNSFNLLTFDDNGMVKEEQYKYFDDEGCKQWILLKKKEDFGQQGYNGIFSEPQLGDIRQSEEKIDYDKKMQSIVRENRLYKTGHFHWKGQGMLNWIDTSYFFRNQKVLNDVAEGIYREFHDDIKEAEAVIGLGMKGSILLSYIRYQFPDMVCSYAPETEAGHNEFEKAILECIKGKKIKRLIILTDVIHTGRTVTNFIKKNEGIFEDDAKVIVIALFNTIPDGDQISADSTVDISISVRALSRLKVINCAGNIEACTLCKNKLVNVYEYTE